MLQPAAPSNNACASATTLLLGSANTQVGTTLGATRDGTASCGASSTTAVDVWYRLTTGPLDQALTITTCGAEIGRPAGESLSRAVRVGFRDTGPGIPEADRARIFTPFFTTKREGHGLGLALVHKTVSDHGGRVQLHSRESVGTEFVILLPVEAPS